MDSSYLKSISRGILLLFLLFTDTLYANDNLFKPLVLPNNIYIEIPSHWTVLPNDIRKNIAVAGESMLKNNGITNYENYQKERLLSVHSLPEPNGVVIRVSFMTPAEYTQQDLENMTSQDLHSGAQELLDTFKKMGSSTALKVIEMNDFKVEELNQQKALVISYLREGVNKEPPWQVLQYKIPTSKGIVEATFSYRYSEAILWQPILERVKQSLRVDYKTPNK